MSDSTITSATKSTSGTLRMAGIYSAVDIDGLVKASLTSEQSRIDKQNKKIKKQEWTNAAYEDINKLVNDFKNTYLSAAGKNSMTLSSALNSRKVEVSDSSTLTVTANGNVGSDKLAIQSYKMATTAAVNSKKLFDNADSKKVTGMTIDEFANKLGFTTSSTREVTKKNDDGTETKETVNTYSFSVNGKSITIDGNKKVSDMLAEINGADADVKASFDTFTGKFSIESTKSGTEGKVKIESDNNNMLSKIFDADAKDQAGNNYTAGNEVQGTDAKIYFEGNSEAFTSSSNKFTIDGYTFSLKGDFNAAADGSIADSSAAPITVKSSVDTDAMVSKIKDFTTAYNNLMNKLYEYAYTKPDRKYEPLTDSEKEKMTDKQIEEYEEKAKQGILYGDTNVKKLMTNLRRLFTSTKSESGLSFAKIGIQTTAYTAGSKTWGNVEIDEKKLKSYLETNADEISKMFTSTTESSVGTKGIAVKMSEMSTTYLNNYRFRVSDRLNTRLSDMKELLEKLTDKLADKEDRLYKKFAAMESSMSTMNGQSSFLFG